MHGGEYYPLKTPLLAWRTWILDQKAVLRSTYYMREWKQSSALAECFQYQRHPSDALTPAQDCSCGVYACLDYENSEMLNSEIYGPVANLKELVHMVRGESWDSLSYTPGLLSTLAKLVDTRWRRWDCGSIKGVVALSGRAYKSQRDGIMRAEKAEIVALEAPPNLRGLTAKSLSDRYGVPLFSSNDHNQLLAWCQSRGSWNSGESTTA